MDNFSLEQVIKRMPLLKYRYIGSLPSNFVPTLPNVILAIINTQPNNMPGEHWIMITMFHHVMYFADFFGLSIKNYAFLSRYAGK